MAFIFPQFIRDQLVANPNLFVSRTLGMAMFYSAPAFSTNDPRYMALHNLADLTGRVGWTEVAVPGYPLTDDQVVNSAVRGNSTYVMLTDWPIDDDLAAVQVRAIAFFIRGTVASVVNPIVFLTNTFLSPVATLVGGDLVTPVPDPNLTGSNRWLFGWANSNPGGSMVEGSLAIQKNAPEFEPAHTQHVWLYPQRVNVMANPSFEGGMNHWRSNGTASQVTSDIPGAGAKAGRFFKAAGGPPLVVESNTFPGRINNDWTIRLLAKGQGQLKIGLMAWAVEYGETDTDWGGGTSAEATIDWGDEEGWALSPDNYLAITVLRSVSEIYEGQLRLEVKGAATELILDQVIVEPGFLLDWEYFDGDTTYGARDDYSWYGGESLKGKTYSLWYNNKRATAGRLFSTKFPDRAALTSEDELKEGLVYQWVPAGTLVEPHWDVLFEGDLQHPVADIAGTAITPYRTTVPGDPNYSLDMGVDDPWPVIPVDATWPGSVATVGVNAVSGSILLPLPGLITRIGEYGNIMASGPYTLNFSPAPANGDVILVTAQAAAVVSSSGWTKVGEANDAYGNYALYAKVCAGDTGISFSTFSGIYARTSAVAYKNPTATGLASVHSFRGVSSSVQVASLTTPDLTGVGLATVRMDYVTGHRATSDIPRPTVYGSNNPLAMQNGWLPVYTTGNTANGPSTTGWFARYGSTLPVETGEPWYNPSTNVQASMSWLIDL